MQCNQCKSQLNSTKQRLISKGVFHTGVRLRPELTSQVTESNWRDWLQDSGLFRALAREPSSDVQLIVQLQHCTARNAGYGVFLLPQSSKELFLIELLLEYFEIGF